MEEKNIALIRSKEAMNFIIVLFATLQKEASDLSFEFEGNKFKIVKKKPDEVIKLKREYDALEEKLFGWFHTNELQIELDEKESKLLRHCAAAAYYFLTEQNDISPAAKKFIVTYEKHFKAKN